MTSESADVVRVVTFDDVNPGENRVSLDLGIPPGFTVQADDLSALVEKNVIGRYELTGRQIIVYVENFSSEQTLAFTYRLKVRFPLRAKTQPGSSYDYYNPEQRAVVQPTQLTVSGGQ